MRIIRFSYRRKIFWGRLERETVIPITGEPWGKIKLSTKPVPLSKVRIVAPYTGGKIILAGLNYSDHAKELDMPLPKQPVIFIKPPTAVTGPNTNIVYPPQTHDLQFEAELAFVIKKTAKNIKKKDADKYILGYTCLNDITARDIQKIDGQWTRAKSFDTFCPIGPWIITNYDWRNKHIQTIINDKVMQDSNTNNLIFTPEHLLEFISAAITLNPGDIISTGTPPGVGPMKPGDKAYAAIEGIGVLKNTVIRPV